MCSFSFLHKPFPIVVQFRDQLWMNAGFVVFIFVFVAIFEPFGIDAFHSRDHLSYTVGATFIGFLVMSLNGIGLRFLFNYRLDDQDWRVSSAILYTCWSFGTVVLALVIYARFTKIGVPTWEFVALSSLKLGAITMMPAGVFLMWLYMRTLQAHIRQAQLWSVQFEVEPAPDTPLSEMEEQDLSQTNLPCRTPHRVVLNSNNLRESLTVSPESLRYMTAADNYVQVYYLNPEGVLVQHLLRSTLKRVALELEGICSFFRCHRAFIVNLEHVEQVFGNAQGYRLKLRNVPDPIPVSRRFQGKLARQMSKAN